MTERTPTRRRTLGLTGSAFAVGLAGCVTDGSGQPANAENPAEGDWSPIQNDSDDEEHDADDGDHDHDVDHELGHP